MIERRFELEPGLKRGGCGANPGLYETWNVWVEVLVQNEREIPKGEVLKIPVMR